MAAKRPIPDLRYKARANNLKSINVKIPLKTFCCVTGVSGSGKSTLVTDILHRSLVKSLYGSQEIPGEHDKIVGAQHVDKVIEIDQSPIGRTPRSNPATELSRQATGKTLYILDEPTTGLHFADIHQLLKILHRLVDLGNTALIIEHNLEVIKTADYLIDLGPEGGADCGEVVATGAPEEVAATE